MCEKLKLRKSTYNIDYHFVNENMIIQYIEYVKYLDLVFIHKERRVEF